MRRNRSVRERLDSTTTLIGPGTYFNGEIRAEGTLRIDGEVDGKVEVAGHVIIGDSGKVRAELAANSCHIAGRFEGTITIENRCEIAPKGIVIGKATVGALVIQDGGVFSGNCAMALKAEEDCHLPDTVTKEEDPVA